MKNVNPDEGKKYVKGEPKIPRTGVNALGAQCDLNLSEGDETAKTCKEYFYFEDPNPRNKFVLYRENLAAQHSIDSAINMFVLTYAQIQKDYPGLGIGDTATDEAVTREVFKQLRTIPPTKERGQKHSLHRRIGR